MGRRLTVSVLDASLKLAQIQAKSKRLKKQLEALQSEEAALVPYLLDRYDSDTDITLDTDQVLEVRLREHPTFSPDLIAIEKDYAKRGLQVPYVRAIVSKLTATKRRKKA